VTRAQKLRLIRLGLIGAILIVAVIILSRHFEVRAQMDRVVESFRAAGPVPFFLAMALLPAVGFPLSAFTLVAGPVFGPTMGIVSVIVCAVVAIALNVALSYWVAARALRPTVSRIVQWLGYQLPDQIQPHAAWPAILVLRIVPVTPFCLQGMLLGLARVPFGPYMLVSILVPSTYATAMITLGDALMRGDRWAMIGAGALFVIVGVALHILRKRFQAASRSAHRKADEPTSGKGETNP
jgi:uncharacterized membrane protein YdjX (TVP38/TMEM64 family)